MIKNCIQLSPWVRHGTAKQLMKQVYGDSNRVIATYHKEIKQWPQIRPGYTEIQKVS